MIILITQRQERNRYGDFIDSLEQDYVNFFSKENFDIIPVPNNIKMASTLVVMADVIVLSGGGDIGKQHYRDVIERYLIEYSMDNNTPLLGICRGMQFINSYFKGKLSTIAQHGKKNRHDIEITNPEIANLCRRNTGPVNSYHNFSILEKNLASELESFAVSSSGNVEGLKHPNYKITGIQWHPERDNGLSYWIDNILISGLR